MKFHSLKEPANFAQLLLALYGIASLVSMYLGSSIFRTLASTRQLTKSNISDLELSQKTYAELMFVQWALLATAAVFFLIWVYRAHTNLRTAQVFGLKYRPWWVVVSYFIPLVNAFLPFRSMSELSQASHWLASGSSGTIWKSMKRGWRVHLWWTLVTLMMLTLLAPVISPEKHDRKSREGIAMLYSTRHVADFFAAIAAGSLILVIRRVTSHQEQFAALAPHFAPFQVPTPIVTGAMQADEPAQPLESGQAPFHGQASAGSDSGTQG